MILALALLACSTPSEPARPPAPAAPPPAAAPAPTPAAQEHHEDAGGEGSAVAPDTYAGIVAEMRTRQATISGLIAAGKLSDIHPEAKALMDLAVAAPGKAASLPAEAKGTVALKALDLKTKADELHDHADAGDAAGAKAAFDAVVADIDALAAVAK